MIRRDGAHVFWLKLGSFPDTSVENARKLAEVELGKFSTGNNPVKAKRVGELTLTLEDAFDQYMTLHAIPKGRKRTDDFRAIWERCIGKMPEAERKKHGRPRAKHPGWRRLVRAETGRGDHAGVRRLHAAIGTTHKVLANGVLEVLRTVFARAIEFGYPATIPPEASPRSRRTSAIASIESGELPAFFKALADDTREDFKHFVLLSLLTGARRTNVLSARWQDVDLTAKVWRIPDTKNGEPLLLPLVPEAVEIFEARKPKDKGFVFPAESATGHLTPPKKRWPALAKRAGVDDLRIHDLRRSMGSWQAIRGRVPRGHRAQPGP